MSCLMFDDEAVAGLMPTSGSVSVVADGVKTYAQLLNSLYALVDTDRIGRNSAVVREVGNSLLVYRLRFIDSSHQYIIFDFSGVDISTAGNVATQTFTIQSSNSTYKVLSAGSYSDNSSAVPTNGTTLTLYY